MENILKLQQKLIPELLEVLKIRYKILRNIKYYQPIGRRLLATNINLSERVVRSETNFLKEQNLIEVNTIGMSITTEGEEVLSGLKLFIREINGIQGLEREIKEKLKIKDVIIISGDVRNDETLLNEIGKAASSYIKDILKDDIVISLTGGNTVKKVIDELDRISKFNNIKVLPGRGGMAKDIETQSNTLVQRFADKLSAAYELLHMPDNLSHSAFQMLLQENDIKEIFQQISHSYILIHGIGIAETACKKRNLPEEIKIKVEDNGGVGEAYGHYFNIDGEIVYSMPFVGIPKEQISEVENIIAVAAGVEKSKAIIAVEKNRANSILITDEATAREIVNILKGKILLA